MYNDDVSIVLIFGSETSLYRDVNDLLRSSGINTILAHNHWTATNAVTDKHHSIFLIDFTTSSPLKALTDLERIKSDPRTKDMPVVILGSTAADIEHIIDKKFKIDDFILAPFDLDEMVLRIKAVIIRSNISKPINGMIKIGEVSIDKSKHRVFLKDEPVTLTPVLFKLLCTLVENQGNVLSPNELLDKVWGYHSDCYENVVSVSVHRLRKKLNDASVMIETLKGVGYMIC